MANIEATHAPETAGASVPRPNSKVHRLLNLLQTGSGATLEDMIEATGWQPHTVRAAITGLRKRGYIVTRHVEGNTTVWSALAAGAHGGQAETAQADSV